MARFFFLVIFHALSFGLIFFGLEFLFKTDAAQEKPCLEVV